MGNHATQAHGANLLTRVTGRGSFSLKLNIYRLLDLVERRSHPVVLPNKGPNSSALFCLPIKVLDKLAKDFRQQSFLPRV